MRKKLTEAGKVSVSDTGRAEIILINPGWGSSGYYSAQLLESAAKENVFPAGTQMHIDHMSAEQARNQPAGSLQTLAAVLTEDAYWNGEALAAEARIGSRFRDIITEFSDSIGTSIAVGADVKVGEAEGRKGQIVEALYPDPLNRVDFVTVAGRGGRINKVLESAIAAEALTDNGTRDQLRQAVQDAFGTDDQYVFVDDFDAEHVWFEADMGRLYQVDYETSGDVITLTGDPIEVVKVTNYTPKTTGTPAVDSPSALAGVNEGKEPTMASVQIEEKRLASLEEASSRVTALEAENKNLKDANAVFEDREAARVKESQAKRAAEIVAEEFGDIDAPKTQARVAESYTTKDGELDEPALREVAKEHAAEYRAATGAGKVTGLGKSVIESKTVSDDDIIAALEGK